MPDTDIDLMQRLKAGDTRSFEELLQRHQKRVLNVIYRYLGHATLAEDLVQEVFLRVYKARQSYKPKAKFTTWLYKITANLCLKELEKRRKKTYSLDSGTKEPAQYIQSTAASPAETMEQKEVAQVVQDALAELPPKQRMAVVLNKYQGFSYEEIAASMELSTKAIKSLLFRARTSLKERLAVYVAMDK